MLEHLKPISGEHSIKQVIATIFLPQNFLKPQDVFNKLTKSKKFDNYQRRSLSKLRSINIDEKMVKSVDYKVNGLIFEEFDSSNGKIKNIFRITNKPENKSLISFETRKYKKWSEFKDNLFKVLNNFSGLHEIYVEAILLNYVDEFMWESNKKIDVESIFNKSSNFLNKKFLESENGTLILISQNDTKNDEEYNDEEKTEVSFNNKMKRIVINHQHAIKLDAMEQYQDLLKNDRLSSYFDKSHITNKLILKDILSDETQKLINL